MRVFRIKYNSAFTVPDLITAISLTALLISISLPSVSEMLLNLKLKKEAVKVSSFIERQINNAAPGTGNYILNLEQGGMFISLGQQPSSIEKVHTLAKNFRLNFSPANKSINLNKQGSCSPASFELTNGVNKCKYSISLRCRLSLNCG